MFWMSNAGHPNNGILHAKKRTINLWRVFIKSHTRIRSMRIIRLALRHRWFLGRAVSPKISVMKVTKSSPRASMRVLNESQFGSNVSRSVLEVRGKKWRRVSM